jgi:di/tricarboxylate transporter
MLRLFAPVAGLSAFMNNTPLVAFFMPIFVDIGRRLRISPGRLLIPLSYASILGGTCTLIGTSTNLTMEGVMHKYNVPGMSMFELAWVGVPVTIVGLLYLATIGQKLLPHRVDLLDQVESDPREYVVEMVVMEGCPLIGQTVRQSGLRDLHGLYLYRIERGDEVVTPVTPNEVLRLGDLFYFSGIVSTVVELQKIRGLNPVVHRPDDVFRSNSLDSLEGVAGATARQESARTRRQLCEVVIGASSPLVGRTAKEADFRARYNASIIAVHRSGHKLQQKIGQIELESGDTLLVDTDLDFPRRWRNSPDFILVSGVEDSAPVAHERAWIAMGIFLAAVISMVVYPKAPEIIMLSAAVLMVLSGCVEGGDIYRGVEMNVLILVGSALGVSQALDKSGAAEWLANGLIHWTLDYGPQGVLVAFVLMTGVLTELLSNNASAALMGTFAIATAHKLGVDPRPLLIAVTVTASYGFATPIGYQTNLMVLNAGGYRFIDYVKVGLPMDLIAWTITILVVPLVWSF